MNQTDCQQIQVERPEITKVKRKKTPCTFVLSAPELDKKDVNIFTIMTENCEYFCLPKQSLPLILGGRK